MLRASISKVGPPAALPFRRAWTRAARAAVLVSSTSAVVKSAILRISDGGGGPRPSVRPSWRAAPGPGFRPWRPRVVPAARVQASGQASAIRARSRSQRAVRGRRRRRRRFGPTRNAGRWSEHDQGAAYSSTTSPEELPCCGERAPNAFCPTRRRYPWSFDRPSDALP